MKFSEQWLREWVDPGMGTDELVAQLTMAGLEVDGVESAAADFTSVLVGEVLAVEAHPDADKLRVCKVSTGSETLQIVCGAPNVRAGMKAPVAVVGAELPGDLKIKKAKLRGVESSGMLCSARELGLADDPAGLMALPADAPVGQDIRAYLGLDDKLIEVDLTPNRGDCLGIAGLAREVALLTKGALSAPVFDPVAAGSDARFPVRVSAPEACPRYLGRVIRGVNPQARTPLWMQEKLRRSGLRSLGPIVDVTNFVLVELGQPMHAFDLVHLDGHVDVRFAREGETVRLLDGREISLDGATLVIADAAKTLAIAGVMGGEQSGVTEATQDLFLECAFFAPETMAGTARRYGLQTDSSYRFERGVDFQLQTRAMERATRLLIDLVGGTAGPVIEVTHDDRLPKRLPIVLRRTRIRRILGLDLLDDQVTDILIRLGASIRDRDDGWEVVPPSYRFDVALEVDLIEEIGRVYGYNRLPSTRPQAPMVAAPLPEPRRTIADWRGVLVQRGYQEAVTYSFVDPRLQERVIPDTPAIALANPISSEMSVMRTSLWPGLLRAVQYNLNRQQDRVRIFEYGLSYISKASKIEQDYYLAGIACGGRQPEQWGARGAVTDFYDVKADVEALLGAAGPGIAFDFQAARHPALHPGQTARILRDDRPFGWLGTLHPGLAHDLELPDDTVLFELEAEPLAAGRLAGFREISRFPAIRRDLAFILPEEIDAARVSASIRAAAGALLQDLVLFDVYQGQGIESGRKSLAFGLILQDSTRTLTDQDVDGVLVQVQTALNDNFGATLRE